MSTVSQLKTMRGRLVRIMLVISGLTGIATFSTVALISVQTSSRHLTAIQQHIEDGIVSKGKVLTRNHALALRGLILDNSFVDMQRLVERAVREDDDVVYGVFINAEKDTLALTQRAVPGAPEGALAKDAWRGLGLAPDEALVRHDVVSHVTRLGQDLLEVAIPVTSDEGEPLGTIRYGLSTRRMQEALARAQAEGRQHLLGSLVWIGSLVSLTTLIGLLLSRMQAFRITRPVGELTEAARALAAGNRTVRVNITSGDELEQLGSSFNHMVEELGSSYRRLEEMNRTLEQKVDERTREIAQKSRDMRLVLDNVDQGFTMLSPAGEMTGGRSRVVGDWFGEGHDGGAFHAYMGQTSAAFGEIFEFAWAQIVEGALPFELAMDQLPRRLTAHGRTWSFRYLPFAEADKLEGVLVVMAEITMKLVREREDAEQSELMQSFSKLVRDRAGFMSFVREADQMVRAICAPDRARDPVALKRTLHTLKGNAAVMGLCLLAAACHSLEDQLDARGSLSEEALRGLSEHWGRINEHIVKFVPGSSERMIEVGAPEYAALLARLSENEGQADLLDRVRAWGMEPASRPLERLAEQGQALAHRLGKEGTEFRVEAGNVRLDAQVWSPFFAELVHVVRNAVDHGIEPPHERREVGKPAAGKVVLGVHMSNDVLTFEVTDDGRGIDWDLIRTRARERGLRHALPSDLLDVLCHDGISTRAEVTETSGRGVGMAALRQCVLGMKGRLEVESTRDGTTWLMRFPMTAQTAVNPQLLPGSLLGAKTGSPSAALS